MSTSNSDEQKALAAGAAALIAAYDLANTNDSLGAVYGTPTQMAKTMALMALAKKNHKDCPFWHDRQVFMTRIIPLFKTYPVYDQNMQASVSADARLHSEAGVFRFDYEKAFEELPVIANCPDAVTLEQINEQRFKNALRNHYRDSLFCYYHGVAKLCVQAML